MLQPPPQQQAENLRTPTALPAKRGQIGKKWEYFFSRTNPVILPFAALTEKTKLSLLRPLAPAEPLWDGRRRDGDP